jgi:Tfp pilus assembly PilM family ATPase
MWNDLVTLYIDDTSLRLLVCQGQTIKKWADMKLEPGLVKDTMVLQEAEVTAKIKQLLQSQEVVTKKVILGFSGLRSLTRPAVLPQLPKAMLPEAVVREARRVLPVPLDQLYLCWRTIPGPKGKVQIYMAATPRKSIDMLVKVLHGAGLELSRMAMKPLALSKVVPSNTAILVDLQPNEYDIVIMVDGVSQPIRTITLPNETLTFDQIFNMIINDLDRTIKFYDTNNPDTPLDTKVPIYIAGELIGKPDIQNALSQKLKHPVVVLSSSMKGPEGLDLQRYSVNIAIAMKTAPQGRESTFPLADLNLLPTPYQPKPISPLKVLGIPGAIALAGLVVPMIIMMQNVSNSISATESRISTTNQTISQRTIQKNDLNKQVAELQKQLGTIQSATDQFTLVSEYFDTQHESVKNDLFFSLSRLRPDITLKSVTLSESALNIKGTAPNKEDIYTYAQTILNYARELDLSQRYIQSTISSLGIVAPVEGSSEGTLDFNLTFERRGN